MPRVIKLACGDDILAQVVSESDSELVVKNILRIMLVPSPSSEGIGLSMMPWLIGARDPNVAVGLDKRNILVSFEPDNELSNAYNQRFGGIVTAHGVPPLKLRT